MRNTLKMARLGSFIILILLLARSASAFELGAVGGLNYASATTSPAENPLAAKVGLGFGLIAGIDLVPFLFSLESGVFSLERKTGGAIPLATSIVPTPTAEEVGRIRESYKVIEIPVLLRLQTIPFVKPGVGIYYARATGDYESTIPVNGIDTTSKSGLPLENDFGLIGSLQARLPLAPLFNIVGDLRYTMGLTEGDYRDGNKIKSREFQFLAGVLFSI